MFRQPENIINTFISSINMYLLTEFVRLLEQRGHIFPNDPQAATESLRHTQGDVTDKLHQRAQIIDRDHTLRNLLHTHKQRLHILLRVALVAWFVFGFITTYGLMQHAQLNFFLILLGVLGMNTLMLLIWLVFTLIGKPTKSPFSPILFHRQNNLITQTWAQLYVEQAALPYSIWRKSLYTHQLALCALLGMFTATLFLFTVRQYSFNWESTLLSNHAFVNSVQILSWLPEKLGFAVPQTDAIVAGRNTHDTAHAASWASLLLGSIICYGIVPRGLAWLFCWLKIRHHVAELNIKLPYYQNIIQNWQRKIIDSDHDYRPDPVAPPVVYATPNSGSEYWAVLLDAPHDNPQWFAHLLGQDWLDCGVVASREQLTELIEKLPQQPTQLLVGVRAHRAPDRGQIRALSKLANHAQHGLIVKLLSPHDAEILAQWHDVLRQNNWAWVE